MLAAKIAPAVAKGITKLLVSVSLSGEDKNFLIVLRTLNGFDWLKALIVSFNVCLSKRQIRGDVTNLFVLLGFVLCYAFDECNMEESLDFQKFYKNKIVKRIDSTNIPIICLTDLIKMKKKANREQDVLDLKSLIELKNL